MVFDPQFDNRSVEGLDLIVDGHGTSYDAEKSFDEYNKTWTTSEAIESELLPEEPLPDEQ
jgi:hypothetical protein